MGKLARIKVKGKGMSSNHYSIVAVNVETGEEVPLACTRMRIELDPNKLVVAKCDLLVNELELDVDEAVVFLKKRRWYHDAWRWIECEWRYVKSMWGKTEVTR